VWRTAAPNGAAHRFSPDEHGSRAARSDRLGMVRDCAGPAPVPYVVSACGTVPGILPRGRFHGRGSWPPKGPRLQDLWPFVKLSYRLRVEMRPQARDACGPAPHPGAGRTRGRPSKGG